jgi:hypothetical protein
MSLLTSKAQQSRSKSENVSRSACFDGVVKRLPYVHNE